MSRRLLSSARSTLPVGVVGSSSSGPVISTASPAVLVKRGPSKLLLVFSSTTLTTVICSVLESPPTIAAAAAIAAYWATSAVRDRLFPPQPTAGLVRHSGRRATLSSLDLFRNLTSNLVAPSFSPHFAHAARCATPVLQKMAVERIHSACAGRDELDSRRLRALMLGKDLSTNLAFIGAGFSHGTGEDEDGTVTLYIGKPTMVIPSRPVSREAYLWLSQRPEADVDSEIMALPSSRASTAGPSLQNLILEFSLCSQWGHAVSITAIGSIHIFTEEQEKVVAAEDVDIRIVLHSVRLESERQGANLTLAGT
ncbi:hypothetical protein BC832DRAFT_536629 [Gaertneriomyces semiglobifer]|nr:hypothetical protein BC832DRAFT_536629 [Gaertneriomyces semiglobifer]